MMHHLYGFLLVHVLTWLRQNAHGSQIINGSNASKNALQYMVSVQSDNDHVCGGFLVSDEFVLTAAHCGEKRAVTHVVLGTHNLKKVDNNLRRKIVSEYKPKSYQSPGYGNDIKLLKVSPKVQLGKRVNLIKFQAKKKLKDNQKCSVAGWGLTKTNGSPADELKVVDVPIINHKVCNEKWRPVLKRDLPENIICAGGYKTKKGFCQGDSGGPLVCNGVAVGIVSFNMHKNCDYPNVPNIYTNISKHIDWIKKIMLK